MPRPTALPAFEHTGVPAGEGEIHVAELPSNGKSVMLLHGIGMDWRVWQALSRRLWPRFHLYALDLRGHGDSVKPDHGYTLAHYAADVEDVIDALGLADVTLVGSSLGGMVAVTVEAPSDVVSSRVLVDPPLTGGPVRDPAPFREILRLKHRPVEELAEYLRGSYPRTGTLIRQAMSEMWHGASDGVITDMLADTDTYFDVGDALSSITCPTLIVQGDPAAGGVLKDAWARQALDRLQHGSLVKVEGAGHAVHADRPEEFVRIVEEFLASA